VPELPEVETTLRGVAPHLVGRRVTEVTVRDRRLRWPVEAGLEGRLVGQPILAAARRAKYLILTCADGSAILHLGMSGSLRLVAPGTPPGPYDHVDIALDSGHLLRLTDPRRFGCLLWTPDDPRKHPRLRGLGPEPLEPGFDGAYLHHVSRGRRAPIKHMLMDGRIVAGLGNIYVNEALFQAGIHPARPAGRISRKRYGRLADAVRAVLGDAIEQGGTTLRNYVNGDGRPGWFQLRLSAYGRTGQPCPRCGTPIVRVPLGQRATYACPRCQR
jgi:formamidopyrimidine-DNA glycosylase